MRSGTLNISLKRHLSDCTAAVSWFKLLVVTSIGWLACPPLMAGAPCGLSSADEASCDQTQLPVNVEVAVLIDEDLFATDVGDIENIPTAARGTSPTSFSLLFKLGSPTSTRILITPNGGRLTRDARRSLSKDSSSAKLDSYLVLTFTDEVAAQNAVKRLQTKVGCGTLACC